MKFMGRRKKNQTQEPADSGVAQENVQEVVVNENENEEAKRGTTKSGETDVVENTESIPQNERSLIETTPAPNEIAARADAERSEESIAFADESNPNQKARNASTDGAQYDQDGNERTGGYSYGVAADDTRGTEFDKTNEGRSPDEVEANEGLLGFDGRADNDLSYLNPQSADESINSQDWSVEDQRKLEEELSDLDAGIRAVVSTSAGNYVRVKFYHNNKPMGTFKSRSYEDGDAQEYLDKLKEEREL